MVDFALEMNDLELGAVWLFLYQRVIPLLDDRYNPNGQVLGCGCLLRLRSGTFFITAAHVFDRVRPEDFDHVGIPAGPYQHDCTTLGSGVIRKTLATQTADVDIAIFPLSENLVANLTWDALRPENLAALRPAEAMNEFLVFGYPNSTTNAYEIGEVISANANPVVLRTGRFFGDTSAYTPKHPDVDLFLAYGDKATDLDGREVAAPALPGISGAPIWALMRRSSSTLWSPELSLRVVAVDSAWTAPGSKNRYIVAKLWTAVHRAFEQFDAEAASEIKNALFL